jgi:CO dehydrogenase/acetyl-CoA synthase delta subunit
MYDKPIIAVKPKKKYIHVNMHKIRANKKHGTNEAVITVKEGRKNTYGSRNSWSK